jgi:hypothetical protein
MTMENLIYTGNSPDFFASGLICGFVIIVAILLIFIIRRVNVHRQENISKISEHSQLEAYELAYVLKNGEDIQDKKTLVKQGNKAKPRKSATDRNKTTSNVEAKQKEKTAATVETAPTIPESKEELMKPEMFDSSLKTSPHPSVGDGETTITEESKPHPEVRAMTTDKPPAPAEEPPHVQSSSPLPRPVSSEDNTSTGEKTPEQDKQDENDAFNLFTNVAVQQSEISKFASKLQDVDITQVSKEAQDLFGIFKQKGNS